ncbi:MAG: hypothetical protein HZA95_01725 [Candidatus Vogelbacteria bacterium]|nr:hypothetical protein [Candidatus Vogelbacteria bacterium]
MKKIFWIGVGVVVVIMSLVFYYFRKPEATVEPTVVPINNEIKASKQVNLLSQPPVNVLSSALLFGPDQYVAVNLLSSDQKTSIKPEPGYCGAPAGTEIYSGNYVLTANSGAVLDLGTLQFAKGTASDGKLVVEQLDPNGYKDFIIMYQYASCNGTFMYVYGYDWARKKIVQYNFISKNGQSSRDVFTRGYKKSQKGNLITSAYDNSVGRTIISEWVFDSTRGAFVENSFSTAENNTTGIKTFTDSSSVLTFSYPSDFALSTELNTDKTPGSYSISCDTTPNAVVGRRAEACLWYVGGETSPGFEAANIEVRVTPTAADCKTTNEQGPGIAKTETKLINGLTFYYDRYGDASAGHRLASRQYRTYYYGNCYSITLNVGWNVFESGKELSAEFSELMFSKLESVLSSFSFGQ